MQQRAEAEPAACSRGHGVAVIALALMLRLLASRSVLAQASEPPPEPTPPSALGGELAYYGADDSASSFSLVRVLLGGRYVYDASWSFTARAGLVALASSPDVGPGDFALRLANPELLAWYDGLYADGSRGRGERKSLRARFALGGTGPLAAIERGADARLHRTALSNASAIDGFGTIWLWVPSRSSALAAAIAQWDAHDDLMLEAEAWPVLLIPSREEFWKEPVDLFVPVVVGARTRGGIVSVGPYLRAVWMPTSDIDQMQLSLEPRLRVEIPALFIETRVTINLDEPLAGRRGPGVWGFHVAAGGSL